MPFIQVTLAAGRPAEEKVRLGKAISKATAEVLGVPESGVRVWLVEVPADLVVVDGETVAERQAARQREAEPALSGTP